MGVRRKISYLYSFVCLILISLSFLIGFLLCSIMLNVVASGVNAVIVLFAEAPGEFQMNHPELSSEMRMAYASAYPTLF